MIITYFKAVVKYKNSISELGIVSFPSERNKFKSYFMLYIKKSKAETNTPL